METSQHLYIKPDAVLSIEIGAGFVQRLQQLAVYLIAERPEEDLQEVMEALQKGQRQFQQEWVNHFVTVYTLIKQFEGEAQRAGLTEVDSPPAPQS